MRKVKLEKQKDKIDRRLLGLTLLLVILGLIAVADASAPQALKNFGDTFYFAKQQLAWAALGVVALFVVANIKYTLWEKLAIPLFIGSVILLILVLIPGIGTNVLGAQRWIIFGPVTVQPSEIIKLCLAIYFAKLTSANKEFLAYLVPLAVVCLLIMLQPDLGTTIVVASIGVAQMFISGISLVSFAGVLLVGGLTSFVLVMISSYRRARLLTFLEATSDPLGRSYHIRQVLFALGLGGFFGVGLGQSRQKYLFLPEAATDSIFAILAEEVGFFGISILLVIYGAFIYFAIRTALYAPDIFSKSLALGITIWIGGQAIINIASMVALVPLTGIPLPLFSYGGSSLTMALIGIGILLNISRYAKKPTRKSR